MSESARGEGGRVWVPRKPQDPRPPKQIPENERYYFLEERYPKYGNLVPRDIATREIFSVCTQDGLSVEKDRLAVYLDLTHIPRGHARHQARRHPGDLREVPGRRSARSADEDLPGRALLDGRPVGRLREERHGRTGRRLAAQPADEHSAACTPSASATISITAPIAWAPTRCLSCIFSGLIVAPGIANLLKTSQKPAEELAARRRPWPRSRPSTTSCCAARRGGENPYLMHQELGNVMTKAATVVRHNNVLARRPRHRSTSWPSGPSAARFRTPATGPIRTWCSPRRCATCSRWPRRFCWARWLATNAAGLTSSPTLRCRASTATDPTELRREAEAWCDQFEANTAKWLKSTIATLRQPTAKCSLSYEDVDTTLIPPRPRLYGLVGADVIEEVWKGRQAAKTAQRRQRQPAKTTPQPAAVH